MLLQDQPIQTQLSVADVLADLQALRGSQRGEPNGGHDVDLSRRSPLLPGLIGQNTTIRDQAGEIEAAAASSHALRVHDQETLEKALELLASSDQSASSSSRTQANAAARAAARYYIQVCKECLASQAQTNPSLRHGQTTEQSLATGRQAFASAQSPSPDLDILQRDIAELQSKAEEAAQQLNRALKAIGIPSQAKA